MNRLSTVIIFIEDKRKILISLFLVVGLVSATIDGIILVQRPVTYQSKASSKFQKKLSVVEPAQPSSVVKFASPKGLYKLSYDPKQWTLIQDKERVTFNLRKEYGYARLDILEGESQKDLDSLKEEIIKLSPAKPISVEATTFKGKSAYLLTYQETTLGTETYYYQQIVKDNNKFLILEKRFPRLSYQTPYLDNLLENISLNSQTPPQVKGISENRTKLTTVELVDLVRPAVVNIVHTYCVDIVNLSPELSKLTKDKYNFCSLSKGSGFLVDEKGVVATNGHVAKTYPEEGLVTNILSGGNKILAIDLIKGVYASSGFAASEGQIEDFYTKVSLNPQYLDHILAEIFKLLDKKAVSVAISNEKYYVNVGNEPIKINYQTQTVIPSSTTYSANMLDFDYPNKYIKSQPGSDVALLQIKNSSNSLFPALALVNTQNLREGSDVIVAGYPVLVEGGEGPGATISFKTSTKPTVTRGIISAIKQDPSGRQVFQTDASIDHGNSGGPAFNLQGETIGIATFFFESKSGNFNFLRDISDLKTLMSKNNIKGGAGKLTDTWKAGLTQFRQSYYKQAIKYFEEVKTLSPTHPTVKEFIKLSQDAIERGESLEGLVGFVKNGQGTNIILVVFGAISIVSFLSAGFLAILPFFTKYDKVA
ncbi:trypsin-like peptidase domain-containing protein [Candidatus Daviesbacteria bacterium]|nr:trypsin-like peptidase domain-containing protein [Candidatus Daviesbacteria bacterium]